MDNTSTKKERIKAIVYTIIAATLLSTGGILLKFIDMNPMAIASSRGIFSVAIVWAYLKKPKFTFSKPQVVGAISYAGMVTGFILANKLTTAANAVVLQFTAPIWVAILGAWILKERIRWYDGISIVIVSLGMILFFIDDMGGGSLEGNIVAILSGVALAGSTIGMRMQKDGSPVETTLLGHFITVLIGLPFLFQASFTIQNIFGIFLLGVFQLGISYILYALAIKHLTALESILIMFLEPILNPIWVVIFYGEKPSVYSLIGGLIVIVTLALRSVIANKQITVE
ncbi:MAG: DMT family transporter [Tissierellaceae bacterium]|nr:DMT family transporter [Tissierellaceae bacterium]